MQRRLFEFEMRATVAMFAAVLVNSAAMWPAEIFRLGILEGASIFGGGILRIVIRVLVTELVGIDIAIGEMGAAANGIVPQRFRLLLAARVMDFAQPGATLFDGVEVQRQLAGEADAGDEIVGVAELGLGWLTLQQRRQLEREIDPPAVAGVSDQIHFARRVVVVIDGVGDAQHPRRVGGYLQVGLEPPGFGSSLEAVGIRLPSIDWQGAIAEPIAMDATAGVDDCAGVGDLEMIAKRIDGTDGFYFGLVATFLADINVAV